MPSKSWIFVLLLVLQAKLVLGTEYNLQSILELAEKNNKDIKLARSKL